MPVLPLPDTQMPMQALTQCVTEHIFHSFITLFYIVKSHYLTSIILQYNFYDPIKLLIL